MPELYEVVGAILRDVAQARFMSDLYSRHISQVYEEDSLLRRFPVPRAEVQSVEFEFKFVITEVVPDENRKANRSALLSQIYEKYSNLIVRTALTELKSQAKSQKEKEGEGQPLTPAQQTALNKFEEAYLSDEYRNSLISGLYQYFKDHSAELVDSDGNLKVDVVEERIEKFAEDLAANSPQLQTVMQQFASVWHSAYDDMKKKVKDGLVTMKAEISEAYKEPGDFKIQVEVTPDKLKDQPALSSIKVVSSIKNYTWSKVDVDPRDLHNIRTLNPE
jgi:hypothetical protein